MKSIDVVAAIICNEGRILATQRAYGEFAGGWEFPGGKIEEGEAPEDALVREIEEELDATIGVDSLLTVVDHDYDTFHLHMYCYLAHIEKGEPHLLEHSAAKWLDANTIDTVDWLPADIELVQLIKEKVLTEPNYLADEANSELPYDKTDRESIYNYALALRGSTLREKTNARQIADSHVNKGSFGSTIESDYFFLDINNKSEADFKEAGLELKTTPLKRNKNGSLSAKERLVIGMIDYMQVVNEEFETSHLMEKAEDILLISYLWDPDLDPLDYNVELVEIVSLPELPDDDLAQIKSDWETVVGKVRNGLAHELSGSDTLYLEACTKGATSKDRRKQPFSDIEAKPRAWALKASFMTAMSNRIIEDMQSIERSEAEQGMTLIQLVRHRFEPFFGLTEEELGVHFGYIQPGKRKPKNLCALITRRILGVDDDAKIEEFEKAGIKPKSMRIKSNGTPKESMSFPNFDYFELVKTPYEDSDFASYMEQRYLFVIFREDASERGTYRLADVAFWQMPDDDLEEAERCYEEMRARVAAGHAEDSVKSTENRCCHVRPHGRNSADTLPTPQGDMVVKKCFWLNANYLKDEIAKLASN